MKKIKYKPKNKSNNKKNESDKKLCNCRERFGKTHPKILVLKDSMKIIFH
jgi:hypothetical protein